MLKIAYSNLKLFCKDLLLMKIAVLKRYELAINKLIKTVNSDKR